LIGTPILPVHKYLTPGDFESASLFEVVKPDDNAKVAVVAARLHCSEGSRADAGTTNSCSTVKVVSIGQQTK